MLIINFYYDFSSTVKEKKHDRDLAESTAEKDGIVAHIITEMYILQKRDLHWSTMQ